MNPGSTTTSRKARKRARNGTTRPHQNRKNSAQKLLRKGYADALLGWTSDNFETLHAQGEHCDQCNVCRSPQESPASCYQVQTTWTSEYRCFVTTWQCSNPYSPFNCYNNPRFFLRVFTHPPYSPDLAQNDFHVFGPLKQASLSGRTKRCSRRCTSGCTLRQSLFFF